MKNPTIFLVFLLSCAAARLHCAAARLHCAAARLHCAAARLCCSKTPLCCSKTPLCCSKTPLCSEKSLLCSEKTLLCSAGAWGAIRSRTPVLPSGLHLTFKILQFYIIFRLNPRPASAQCPGKALVCQKKIFCRVCIFPQGPFFLEKIT